MGSCLRIACVSALLLLGVDSSARTQQNPYRLKVVDQQKLCLSCHTDFEQTLKERFVHTPVRTGDCSGCHDPHVSSHGKLLSEDTNAICARCHDRVIPENPKSVHQVVADGECVKCHDPHASANADNLLLAGTDLCISCHQELGETVRNARFQHSPVEQGCSSCHGPHGSDTSADLLKASVPSLCVTCHRATSASFVERHMGYPVANASCTSCHDPHGSDTPALMLDDVHPPVSNRMCSQCHEAPDSATPFATKQPGFELCKGCHSEMVNTTLAKRRLHWPVADKDGCGSCHSPHASKHDKLLRADTVDVCRTCHADTLTRIAATPVTHTPVSDGLCVMCHSPHAADGVYLVDQPSMDDLCVTCHDYTTHSAHPLGEEAVDPRNPNLRVQCLSCHKGHGTQFERMLLNETNVELCTRCHRQFVR